MIGNFDCPICNEFHFSKPQLGDEIGKRRCHVCGWVVNEKELNNPTKLAKYKKVFLNHRKKDPEWNYWKANAPTPKPHKCPICGRTEFPDEASYDICGYCGWEDDGVQTDDPNYAGGANDLCLNDYKKKYKEIIKKDPKFIWEKNPHKYDLKNL